MANNLIYTEVSTNLKHDNRILTNIKSDINLTFKKNLYYNVVWHLFHSFSVNYVPPTSPTPTYKTDIYLFMNNVKKSVTGCSSCSTDDSYFIINNMEDVIFSKYTMVEWFVNLHNNINIKKNEKSGPGTFRTDWTAQEVIDKYQQTDYKSILFNQYGIDMNILSTFYTELKKIKTIIDSDKTEYADCTFDTFGLNGKVLRM